MSDKTINENTVQAGATKVTENDARKVVDNAQNIVDKVLKNDTLKGLISDVTVLVALVRDFVTGKYKDVPWATVAAVVFALLYLLSPVDLIPDFIPILGLTDDAAVIVVCLRLIAQDLEKYRAWQAEQARTVTAEAHQPEPRG